MRLGNQLIRIAEGTLANKIYGNVTVERHRHRYEFNNVLRDSLQKSGLVCSGETEKESLVEIIELCTSEHPWFLGVQFHPEFNSNPREGHPLFIEFIKAGIMNSEKNFPKGKSMQDLFRKESMKLLNYEIGVLSPYY